MSEWLKLPGLFHRFELEQVIDADGHHAYRFEQAGADTQGRELIAVYCRRFDLPRGAFVTADGRAVQPVNEDCVGGAQ
jgi:hypothetical protein